MTAFNINALAREVLHESVSPDPGIMAEDLVARIPAAAYRDALVSLARSLMREMVRAQRSQTNGGAPATGSRKVAAARDAWKRLLDTPEFVPSVGWLFLRDATWRQVLEMSRMRDEKASELRAAAGRYARLAGAMKNSGAAKVADLPDDTLAELLSESEEDAA